MNQNGIDQLVLFNDRHAEGSWEARAQEEEDLAGTQGGVNLRASLAWAPPRPSVSLFVILCSFSSSGLHKIGINLSAQMQK